MASIAAARKVALSCPEAVEASHHGHPDFRVGGKVFMTLWPAERRAVVKLPVADQQALAQMDPEAFGIGGWAHQGWTSVQLAKVNVAQLRALADAAWRNVAPPRLLEKHPLAE
jgi:hypothetical protein